MSDILKQVFEDVEVSAPISEVSACTEVRRSVHEITLSVTLASSPLPPVSLSTLHGVTHRFATAIDVLL